MTEILTEVIDNKEVVKLTPMMIQWKECKAEAKNAILFFRLGDFYEAFYEDAEIAAKELNLTLTERQGTPMCGVPWHTSEGYIDKLVAKGFRVAIAEQIEDPKLVKGLVKRKVVRIITPGTQISSNTLEEKTHNFIGSITREGGVFGLALLDVTTASFFVFECFEAKTLANELFRFSPKELLCSKKFQEKEKELLQEVCQNHSLQIQREEEWRFDRVAANQTLCQHFKVAALDGFGLKNMGPAIGAAGALLQHVRDELLIPVDHISTITLANLQNRLFLDRATLSNLEIVEPLQEGKRQNTLLYLIDETKTPMGARRIREWLKAPLLAIDEIQARQEAVAEFLKFSEQEYVLSCGFDDKLKQIRDLERLIIRIQTGYAGPREYAALRQSLEALPAIKSTLKERFSASKKLIKLVDEMAELSQPLSLIKTQLVDNPPLRVSDGSLFKRGFHKELDELLLIKQNSHDFLAQYQQKLREETGIKTLKVGFNKMFGYYIEVSKGQTEKMPESFVRRQTLVNGERYISEELKAFEEKILSADEKITALENELFQKLRDEVSVFHEPIMKTAFSIAEIDCLRALSVVAEKRNFKKPEVDNSLTLHIVDGRHPVIEALSAARQFIANDIFLDSEKESLMLITGPNMAGKSTYIRQVALIVILAQIGSFVPAKEARIGIVDKLFSRIGASDDLARGQSTFMVEMAETASILNQATLRSLVILDEIGRGTSTYDGISIAFSVAEYLLKAPGKRCKTLFATHYYELTELEAQIPGAVNYTVAVSEKGETITFLHKIIRGKTDRSYGIHVAEIAGLPSPVVERAKALLKELEAGKAKKALTKVQPQEPDLFTFLSKNSPQEKTVLESLRAINVNNLTPLQALQLLADLQKILLTL